MFLRLFPNNCRCLAPHEAEGRRSWCNTMWSSWRNKWHSNCRSAKPGRPTRGRTTTCRTTKPEGVGESEAEVQWMWVGSGGGDGGRWRMPIPTEFSELPSLRTAAGVDLTCAPRIARPHRPYMATLRPWEPMPNLRRPDCAVPRLRRAPPTPPACVAVCAARLPSQTLRANCSRPRAQGQNKVPAQDAID